MDRLELIVDDAGLEKLGQRMAIVVDEALEIGHEIRDAGRVGRHEDGVPDRGAADPVLAPAEFAGQSVLAAHAFHEYRVRLANQARGEGQRFELLDRLVHGRDIVMDLLPIVAPLDGDIGLGQQRLVHIRPGSFDAGGLGGLLDHVHADEQIHIGDVLREHVQPPHLAVGLSQQRNKAHVVDPPLAGEQRRLEGRVAASLHR